MHFSKHRKSYSKGPHRCDRIIHIHTQALMPPPQPVIAGPSLEPSDSFGHTSRHLPGSGVAISTVGETSTFDFSNPRILQPSPHSAFTRPLPPLNVQTNSPNIGLIRNEIPTIPYTISPGRFSNFLQIGHPPGLGFPYPQPLRPIIPSLHDLLNPNFHRGLGRSPTFVHTSTSSIQINYDMFKDWFGIVYSSNSIREECARYVNRQVFLFKEYELRHKSYGLYIYLFPVF